MDLHGQIMNLPQTPPITCQKHAADPTWQGYIVGHRDARHAAAELALSAELLRDELLIVARMIDAHYSGSLDHQPAYVKLARNVLARHLVSG